VQESGGLASSRISIIRLEPNDWQTLRDLRLNALLESPRSFLADLTEEQAYDEKLWQQELAKNVWIAAVIDSKKIGLAKLNRSAPPDHSMHLEGLWVAPDTRGQGVGEQLVSALEGIAEEVGAVHLKLWVFVANRIARNLYERLGYNGPRRVQPIKANDRITFEVEYQKPLQGFKCHIGPSETVCKFEEGMHTFR
jgi:ribosomal protein S18 acetylase RimI-like enzyme